MSDHFGIHQEIEIKLDLGSFTNYLKLVGFLGQLDHEERQVNTFFDTEDHKLSSDGWALRMRSDQDKGIVTMKSRSSASEIAAVREEIEVEIPREEATEVQDLRRDIMSLEIAPIQFVREKWGDVALARIVHFENTRQHKSFKFGDYMYDLEIDTTHFADGSVEYELEVELSDEAQAVTVTDKLQKLLSTLDIPFERQARSKLARALEKA